MKAPCDPLSARLNREVGARGRVAHFLRVVRVLPHYFRVKRQIEAAGLEGIREKYGPLFTGESPALAKGKYLRLGGYLRRDLSRAVALGLHRSSPKKILDLGSGAGYFLLICENFGHYARGIDVPEENDEPRDDRLMHRFYSDMIELLGVGRTFWTIRPFEALPTLTSEPFDVVTAHQASFHRENLPSPWGVPEWEFFIDDIWSKTTPKGRLVMLLNPDLEAGSLVEPDVRSFLEASGARIEGWSVVLTRPVDKATSVPALPYS